MTERFRDRAQQQAVCDRVLRLAHYNLETLRCERMRITEAARVRRARTLCDLALALWDGDGQLAISNLVDLDRDTRTMVADLIADLGLADYSRLDRWITAADAALGLGETSRGRS